MTLDAAVRQAILRAPCTMRALARQVGVSHVMLQGIVTGRERASERIARNVARALERMATRSRTEAARVRAALAGQRPKGGSE